MSPSEFSLGLTGFPLEHSISPLLHQAALAAIGLVGSYRLYPVRPSVDKQDGLTSLLNRIRSNELHGLNVTVPHKQSVIPLLDELTPAARAIGAVNTIFLRENLLVGDNTDAPGFLADLERLLGRQTGHALVLGAGGSGRAVVYSLSTAGWDVTIAARRIEQAKQLLASFSSAERSLAAIHLDGKAIGNLKTRIDLVVNCTSVGMWPHINASPWPSDFPIPAYAAVYDLVYNPPQTRLVGQARALGAKACSGLGMLVEQAALAFERWTGMAAPRQAMWAAAPHEWKESSFLEGS